MKFFPIEAHRGCSLPRRFSTTVALSATLVLAMAMTLANSTAAARPLAVPLPAGHLTVVQRGTSTVLAYAARRQLHRTVLPTEDGIYADALQSGSLVGAVPGRMLILSTTYASRPHGPSHMCGAGTETVIRVVALRPRLRQTFTARVESCWTTIEAGQIEWSPSAHTLLIERSEFGGAAEGHTVKIYAVQADGTVRLQSAGG